MIDRTIPFYNLILRCDAYCESQAALPQGYSFKNYQYGDEKEWAKLEYEIGDFDSVREAEKYFLSTYTDIEELKKRCVFLLNDKNKIIGSCIAWKDKKDVKTVASLHWLVVSPQYQGKKLGKALLQRTMKIFCDENELPVYIHTQPWSYVAVLLYVRNGFKIQKADTFAHYKNEYNDALRVLKSVLTEEQYSELQKNSEDHSRITYIQNPWKTIPLADYENHMQLDSVMQLQAMNEMMKAQLNAYPVSDVMILGIAGGNGLEHISKDKFKKVYGVDINSAYLKEVVHRYPDLDGILECLCINLIDEYNNLPKSDMVVANLVVEYIGYKCFKNTIQHVCPKYVSCIIQINMEDNWVSDSPYLHVFDRLEQIHHQMDAQTLEKTMCEIGYYKTKTSEHMLPNEKKLVQIDFIKLI